MDYGKFKYERKKRQKNAAGSHAILLKEIRLRPKTDAHDRLIKMNHAIAFLNEGHKVQFTMLFRGRERAHRDIAQDIFKSIVEELGETVKMERFPSMEGRRMTMVVSPAKPTKSGIPGLAKHPTGQPAPPTTSSPPVSSG
jgi:translation initiation factor IF-3